MTSRDLYAVSIDLDSTPPHRSSSSSARGSAVSAAAAYYSAANGTPDPRNRFVRTAALQNKREMFFRGEPTSNGTTASPAVAKDAVSSSMTTTPSSSHAPVASSASTTASTAASAVSTAATAASSTSTQCSAATASTPAPAALANGRDNKENRPETAPKPDGPATSSTAAVIRRPSDRRQQQLQHQQLLEQQLHKPVKQLDGYVGYANLPNQVYRRAVKRGFHFTLMVVGESGLGKSTLVNSMFMGDIYSHEYPGPSLRVKKTVVAEKTVVRMKENGVNLTLTVVDTPGFGDAVNNSDCWQPVTDYIEQQYEEYLNAESCVHRSEPVDSRVHCCIYFVAPSGHSLKPLDVEFMKRLHDKVNIIPVIAKADSMTPDEVQRFKKQIMADIVKHKIRIYQFPDCEDEDENRTQKKLRERVPFAVIGANSVVEVDGKKVRGRCYPWGVVQVENMAHSDFIPLRDMLIRTHMMDLRDVTNNVHYENYRCRTLAGVGSDGTSVKIANKNPLAQMEEEKRDHELKMRKMEAEMEQVFEMKVKEKKNKLNESEEDLEKRERQMMSPLDEQRRQLAARRSAFERERAEWEQTHAISLEQLRSKQLGSHSKETVDGKKKKKGLF